MSEIPEEAVTAAAAVHMQAMDDLIGQVRTEKTEAHIARVMLEAAAPILAAGAREWVRQLAVKHNATYRPFGPGGLGPPDPLGDPFADLLEYAPGGYGPDGRRIERAVIERDEDAGIEGDPDEDVFYDPQGNGWKLLGGDS